MAETLRVTPADPEPEVVDRAVEALSAGELLIYPTDTLYALGCRAADPAATRRVREAKGRDEGKPLPLIAADEGQVEEACGRLGGAAAALARQFWPGPLTLVLRAGRGLPIEVTAGASGVAVRIPRAELARRLAGRVGLLVSTSANRAGAPAPATCSEAVAQVGHAAALALDGGPGAGPPSTIVDVTGPEPRLLRAGPVRWPEIEAALHGGGR